VARHVFRVTLQPSDHVIVVGAGLAGWRLVEFLRREGYEGAITLVGDEAHAPYDRPPLSKQVLTGRWDVSKSILATPEKLADSHATVLLSDRAVALDVESITVELASGKKITGTHVVIATGARARPLSYPSSGELMTLRSYDDALRLCETLDGLAPDSVVVIIGGGFIGGEAATSMKARGLVPIVLEAAERPLITVLGDEVSAWLQLMAGPAGIDLRTRQQIRDVAVSETGATVYLEDGNAIEASAVLAAVGSAFDLEWLASSGLTLDGGIVVDRNFEAAPHVAAIGDVAKFPLRGVDGDELVRIEHWQLAVEHALELARSWMSDERAIVPMVPYFWSDQMGRKIQLLGHPHPSDDVTLVEGSPEELKWLALYSRHGLVTGVVALSNPRGLTKSRPVLNEVTTLENAFALAPWSG
jgi:3-phenylpropionate/trans-cinnamate dioxygenase ferredoxin reductase component